MGRVGVDGSSVAFPGVVGLGFSFVYLFWSIRALAFLVSRYHRGKG